MYDSIIYQGRTLKDWQIEFNYEFTLGELYRMSKEGEDFRRLVKVIY